VLVAAALTVGAEPVLRYTHAATTSLLAPAQYIDAVMAATPVQNPVRMPAKSAPETVP